jgi:hypothetical protein
MTRATEKQHDHTEHTTYCARHHCRDAGDPAQRGHSHAEPWHGDGRELIPECVGAKGSAGAAWPCTPTPVCGIPPAAVPACARPVLYANGASRGLAGGVQ